MKIGIVRPYESRHVRRGAAAKSLGGERGPGYRFGAQPTVNVTMTLRPGSKFNWSAGFGA